MAEIGETPRYRMLIADDDPQLCEFLQVYLSRAEFDVDCVVDGREALDRVAEQDYDVVLLDQRMPGLTGLQVIEALQSGPPRFPIILLSAHSGEQLAVAALRAGAVDYVHKAVGPDFSAIVRDKALRAIWRFEKESSRQDHIVMLQQRISELGCLYALEKLFESIDASPRSALLSAADIIIPSTAHTKSCCVVIHIGKEQYPSSHVFESVRQERFRIAARGQKIGFLEVRFKDPEAGEGGSRYELTDLERDLMAAISDRIGSFVDFWNTEQRLRESNAELEEYASVASHDLQAPLQKIESFAKLLQEDYGDRLDDVGGQYLEVIVKSAARMRRLIKDILALSRLDAGEIIFRPVDLNEVMSDVKDLLSRQLLDRKAELRVGALPVIRGESTRLIQLLQNLVSNALKFNESEKPLVEVGAELDVDQNHWVYVRDNGIGMTQQDTERIFLPFKRLHGDHRFEGTGIGLALCRKIVRQHEGVIDVESEPGKGSTFWIQFPKQMASEAGVELDKA